MYAALSNMRGEIPSDQVSKSGMGVPHSRQRSEQFISNTQQTGKAGARNQYHKRAHTNMI